MFWRAVPGSVVQGSAVDAILDREAFTLADLLDEEDLVQEARALNGRLVDYLRSPDVVRQLLEYAVGPPPEGE
jgi:serine/threonine-protein phosphatase 6 regulatory subunit 3